MRNFNSVVVSGCACATGNSRAGILKGIETSETSASVFAVAPVTASFRARIKGSQFGCGFNHPVQGSSAEVMQIALTRLDQALREEPVQIIATVHDEAVLLIPDDVALVKRIGAIAQREMVCAFLEVFPDAPILNLVDQIGRASCRERV